MSATRIFSIENEINPPTLIRYQKLLTGKVMKQYLC